MYPSLCAHPAGGRHVQKVLFRENGEIFCLPEMSKGGLVQLFRARQFPFDWELVATLIPDFAGIDNTLVHYEGRWWLFNVNMHDAPHRKLFLWHAEKLTGPWQSHPLNPVKDDAGSARPGGHFFWHEGQLYRPAMDCRQRYGDAMTINRIVRLTPDVFEEEPVKHLTPYAEPPFNQGMHTLSAAGPHLTLVDGKQRKIIPAAILGKLHKKLRPHPGKL